MSHIIGAASLNLENNQRKARQAYWEFDHRFSARCWDLRRTLEHRLRNAVDRQTLEQVNELVDNQIAETIGGQSLWAGR